MDEVDDTNSIREMLLSTCRDVKQDTWRIPPEMGNTIFNYILAQCNRFTENALVNEVQFQQILKDSIQGLFEIIYVTHYDDYHEPLEVEPLEIMGTNILRQKFSEIWNGRTREMNMEAIKSKQPVQITQVGRV